MDQYEFAKINSDELWRFYIDGCRQNMPEGIVKGRDLFEDERGYMEGMMRAHHLMNHLWDNELTPQLILELHASATHNVQSTHLPFLIDEAPATRFKDNREAGFPLAKTAASIQGIIELLKKITSSEIPYANTGKNYTVSKKSKTGGVADDSVLVGFYTDAIYEQLQSLFIDITNEEISEARRNLGVLNKMLLELESECQHLEQESAWMLYNEKDEERQSVFIRIKVNELLLNRMMTLTILRKLEADGNLFDIATRLMANVNNYMFMPPRYTHEENEEKVADYIKKYQDGIKQAENNSERKLDVIINFIQSLEQLHPFGDGNCRTFVMLLLNRELIKNGFQPTMMSNPNQFDLFSINELKNEVKKGWEYAQKYQSSVGALTEYRELYELVSFHQKSPSSLITFGLFMAQVTSEQTQILQEFLLKIKDENPDIVLTEIEHFNLLPISKNDVVKPLIDNLHSVIAQLTKADKNMGSRSNLL